MAWGVFRLRMEEKASRYGGQLRIYWTCSRGQPTSGGGPQDWGKNLACYKEPPTWIESSAQPNWVRLAQVGTGGGFCEQCNEPLDSIRKGGYCLTSGVTISFSNNILHQSEWVSEWVSNLDTFVKVKKGVGKVVPVLSLTEPQAMKVYWGVEV